MLLLLMKAMSQLNSQYQHAIEVDLRVFVDQVDLIINKDGELIEREKHRTTYFADLFDMYCIFPLYVDSEKLIYASSQLHREQYY